MGLAGLREAWRASRPAPKAGQVQPCCPALCPALRPAPQPWAGGRDLRVGCSVLNILPSSRVERGCPFWKRQARTHTHTSAQEPCLPVFLFSAVREFMPSAPWAARGFPLRGPLM